MKIYHFFQQVQRSLLYPYIPSITLCFKNLPKIQKNQIIQTLQQIEPFNGDIQFYIEEDANGLTFQGNLEFENHKIQFLGNSARLSDAIIESCVHTAHWQEHFKNKILTSQATISLVYAGNSTDPVENYIALYKVAACFYGDDLLGVINEPAWTYHPAEILPKIIFNNMVNLCRNSPPFLFWTGFIKTSLDLTSPFSHTVNNCFFTKGHHVFGIPDLAFYSSNADPMKIKKIFNDIIEYAWFENKNLEPGDFVGFDNHEVYELVEPDEKIEFLESPTKTLVLRMMNQN